MMQRSEKTIFTIGTSTRSLQEFVYLICNFGITLIIDIRRFPKSTRYPYFNKESLARNAKTHGLGYVWLGELLGGCRKGGYEAYRTSSEYLEGLEKLENLGQKKVSTLVCAELLPWKCHRMQVSRDLEARGWKVIHIIDEKRTWEPSRGQTQTGFPFPKNR
ncbi:MAG TPA: DUF488 domain-containing protein [Desulfobacteraceae bacterium]|nr:DUF488 domain-containing protein [Desulfobacteraceae bacterium]